MTIAMTSLAMMLLPFLLMFLNCCCIQLISGQDNAYFRNIYNGRLLKDHLVGRDDENLLHHSNPPRSTKSKDKSGKKAKSKARDNEWLEPFDDSNVSELSQGKADKKSDKKSHPKAKDNDGSPKGKKQHNKKDPKGTKKSKKNENHDGKGDAKKKNDESLNKKSDKKGRDPKGWTVKKKDGKLDESLVRKSGKKKDSKLSSKKKSQKSKQSHETQTIEEDSGSTISLPADSTTTTTNASITSKYGFPKQENAGGNGNEVNMDETQTAVVERTSHSKNCVKLRAEGDQEKIASDFSEC